MAVNHKLTQVVKDRVVQNFQLSASLLLIDFVDGSKMTVTIAECNSPPLQVGARIRQVSEDQTKLLFECEDDSTLDVTIVDPGNAVIIRTRTIWSSIWDNLRLASLNLFVPYRRMYEKSREVSSGSDTKCCLLSAIVHGSASIEP